MLTPKDGELGEPVRIIEVQPLVSPLPLEIPDAPPAELEPEHEEVEVEAVAPCR